MPYGLKRCTRVMFKVLGIPGGVGFGTRSGLEHALVGFREVTYYSLN